MKSCIVVEELEICFPSTWLEVLIRLKFEKQSSNEKTYKRSNVAYETLPIVLY